MRKDKKRTPRQAGTTQTNSFKEWCLFLEDKLGNRQGWSKNYRDAWHHFIEEFGVEVMIGYVMDREFYNVEYAAACLEDLKGREDRPIMETLAREKYWQSKKVSGQGPADPRFDSMAGSLAQRMAIDEQDTHSI